MEEYQIDRLGQTEYEETLLDTISKVVINRNYIEQNQLFWDNIVFKFWEEYYFSRENISIRKQAKFLEIFMDGVFKFKPSNSLPEDEILLK